MAKKYFVPNRIVIVSTLLVATLVATALFFIIPTFGKGTIVYSRVTVVKKIPVKKVLIVSTTHVQPPKNVRAIYMSQCAASSKKFRNRIVELVTSTEINTIVIDVKDFTGTVSFKRTPQEGKEILKGKGCVVADMQQFIDSLHKKDIYIIARITVFQDPLYTKIHPSLAVQSKKNGNPWKDYKGLSFVDVGARPFWDYIVAISNDAQNIGFDELNFDYMRYPSDGPMSDVVFNHSDYTNRALALERFFKYLTKKVRTPDATGYVPKLSVDFFGMTTTNKDDLNIGQVLERATPYFDYVYPMTYPSHYPRGFIGYTNPNDNVYGVVKYSLDSAVKRLESATTTIASLAYTRIGTSTPAIYRKPVRTPSILRPWLQDFNYGGIYGKKKVRAQIQAAYDAGVYSWLLWSAANTYTKSALKKVQ